MLGENGSIRKHEGFDIEDMKRIGYDSITEVSSENFYRILNGQKPLLQRREENYDTITFYRDGSYVRIIPQFHSNGIDFDYVYSEGAYELVGTTLTQYPHTGQTVTYEIEINDNEMIYRGNTYRRTR